jgi:glycosyltransferase involved in cell wall biosynthesis
MIIYRLLIQGGYIAIIKNEIKNICVSEAIKASTIVGIPAYNEEISIGSVILRSSKYADKIIVIDDGSTDNTAEIAELAGAKVISHKTNQGKGTTVRDIFNYAKKVNAAIVILIDGDGQHNPDEIPLLIKPILKDQADIVIGSRFLEKRKHNVPGFRRIGQEVLTLATNVASKSKVIDTQSGFRAFSRKTFDCFSFQEPGMGIESEMLVDAANADLKISEVQANIRYDVKGSTYGPIVHGFSVLGSVIGLISRKRPIVFFGMLGFMLLIAGLAFSILAFVFYNDIMNLVTNAAKGFLSIISGMFGILPILSFSSYWGFMGIFSLW